jgi:hypothetical protein
VVIDAQPIQPRRTLFDVNEAIQSHSSISPNRMDEFYVRLKEFEASSKELSHSIHGFCIIIRGLFRGIWLQYSLNICNHSILAIFLRINLFVRTIFNNFRSYIINYPLQDMFKDARNLVITGGEVHSEWAE